MALPAVLRNALIVAPLAALNTTAYLVLNHHPIHPPSALPLGAVDRAIPFLVWTVWPYAALLLADVVLPLFLRDPRIFQRTLGAYAVAIGLNILVWFLFPTTYPRPAAPEAHSFSAAAYRLLVSLDSPGNCLPSGHITIPAVACWGLAREHPRWSALIWSVFGALSLSILTTKQHYAVDLLAGLATAFAGVAAAHAFRRERTPTYAFPP